MESDIADLDAVLAELEGIQTGDLLSCEWFELCYLTLYTYLNWNKESDLFVSEVSYFSAASGKETCGFRSIPLFLRCSFTM